MQFADFFFHVCSYSFKLENWSMDLTVTAAISVLIPLHVVEEWVFPGGFHYHYNTVMKSKQLDRYPMSRLTDMLTNFIKTLKSFC